jgi:hypothetical protein
MTWDEAYCAMQEGAAVARASWQGIHYLFWERDLVWAFHSSGRVQCYQHYFQRRAGDETDWFIVADVSKPPVPAPSKPVGDRRYYGKRLANRQAEMKRRLKGGAVSRPG